MEFIVHALLYLILRSVEAIIKSAHSFERDKNVLQLQGRSFYYLTVFEAYFLSIFNRLNFKASLSF